MEGVEDTEVAVAILGEVGDELVENTVIEMMAADGCMTIRSLFLEGGLVCMIMTTAELGVGWEQGDHCHL